MRAILAIQAMQAIPRAMRAMQAMRAMRAHHPRAHGIVAANGGGQVGACAGGED